MSMLLKIITKFTDRRLKTINLHCYFVFFILKSLLQSLVMLIEFRDENILSLLCITDNLIVGKSKGKILQSIAGPTRNISICDLQSGKCFQTPLSVCFLTSPPPVLIMRRTPRMYLHHVLAQKSLSKQKLSLL